MKGVILALAVFCAAGAHAQTAAGVEQLRAEATAAQARGDRTAAIAALEAAVALKPDDVDLLRRLGTAQAQAGQTDAALATLARARQLAPSDGDVKLAIAQTHYYRGEAETALRLAEEVLAVAPANADARELIERARRAVRGEAPRMRLDLYGSYSDFDDDARKRWLESGIGIGYRVDPELTVTGRVDVADRFGKTDVALEAGVDGRVGAATSFNLAAGATPNADFLPQWLVRAGARTRLREGGADRVGDTIFTLDARYAEYRSGSVETVSPGVEQYFAGGRFWATGRLIFTWDENGDRQTGWLVRGDGQLSDRLRLFAGYADAPETSENITLTTQTLFAGAVIDVDDRWSLRADYARDDREASYVRNVFTLGVGVRF